MTLDIKKSTEFKINELAIVTKAGNIDISGIYEEINIFDSMLVPVMSGNILIKDSVGLSGKLLFDGSESLLIEILKSEKSDVASFKKAFRIYKQSDRKNDGLNNETYLLYFVSDEFVFSNQQRINQSFQGTYSKIIEKIIVDYLKIPRGELTGVFEETYGIKKIVIPNLKPLEAIEWCTKRSVDSKLSPNYMFFQNAVGYNFASLSNLLKKEDILDIKFEPKNQKGENSITEMSSARAFEVVSQNDTLKKIKDGVNAGQFIGFDPLTRTTSKRQISFGDVYTSMDHGNKTPNFSVQQNRAGVDNQSAFDSKKTISSFNLSQNYSKYIKKADPNLASTLDNMEDYLFQRKSIISNLMSKRIKVAMPGNFQLTSGFNVNVVAPEFAKKQKGDDNIDPSLSGKYIIIATRHIIGYEKHETVIEIATTSTENDFIPTSNPQQTQEVLNYT
jgi:hypothetical protein